MREREYRDSNLRLIGRIYRRSDGREEARALNTGSLLGTYDPLRDETRDPKGSFLGRGNFLSRMIRR